MRQASFSKILLFALVAALPTAAFSGSGKVSSVTLSDVEGKRIKLEYAGSRLTLVNFWATWCLPCREEIPQIVKLAEEYKDKGLKVYGIAMDSGSAPEIKSFLDENKAFGVTYPILVGTDRASDAFGGVMAVPTTYLLDAQGKVIVKHIGIVTDFHAKLSSEIAGALALPDPAKSADGKATDVKPDAKP